MDSNEKCQLHKAIDKMIEFDDINSLLSLLESMCRGGKNKEDIINERNENRETPLHIAVHKGLRGVVKILLEKGAKTDIEDIGNLTVLHIAVNKGLVDLTSFLLKTKVNPNIQNKDGTTPLHCAARDGNFEILLLLLEKGAENIGDCNKRTPLHMACSHGRLKIVNSMLGYKHIKNVNSESEYGRTPVSLLIEQIQDHRINESKRKIESEMAVMRAIRSNDMLMLEALLRFNDVSEAEHKFLTKKSMSKYLYYACTDGNIKAARMFLNYEVDVNQVMTPSMHTSLCAALEVKYSDTHELVKLLINSGAAMQKRGRYSKTPLHYAANRLETKSAALLLNRGVNPNLKDSDGKTPICYVRCLEMVELLLEYGADVTNQILGHFSSEDYSSVFFDGVRELLKQTMMATKVAYNFLDSDPRDVSDVYKDWHQGDNPSNYWKYFGLDCEYEFSRLSGLRFGNFDLAFDFLKENTEKWKECTCRDTIFNTIYSESFQKTYPIYTKFIKSKYWMVKTKTKLGMDPPVDTKFVIENASSSFRKLRASSSGN